MTPIGRRANGVSAILVLGGVLGLAAGDLAHNAIIWITGLLATGIGLYRLGADNDAD